MMQVSTYRIQDGNDPCLEAYGYMDDAFSIREELKRRDEDVEKLNRLTNILKGLSEERINQERQKLENALAGITGYTKTIVEHANRLHAEFVNSMADISQQGKITKEGYSNYLKQGWYHTRYTPGFEHMFTDRLETVFKERPELNGFADIDDKDNKFAKLAAHNIDEEEGHELWALMDILRLGCEDRIDVMDDIYPECKAIVWSQHDRLSRLPLVGFLGYSFYLEYMIASHSVALCDMLCAELNLNREDNQFIYFHYLVDQGHSIDNIQLFDRLIQSKRDCKEVIDNMNFIHTMYKGMTIRSFTQE